MRELSVRHRVAVQRQMSALLLEFNIHISSKAGGLSGVVEGVLENAEKCTFDSMLAGFRCDMAVLPYPR
tara:strand:+ start:426 stop:632 length:207 start_codon:yes stop_codon:yes gene_type:complete